MQVGFSRIPALPRLVVGVVPITEIPLRTGTGILSFQGVMMLYDRGTKSLSSVVRWQLNNCYASVVSRSISSLTVLSLSVRVLSVLSLPVCLKENDTNVKLIEEDQAKARQASQMLKRTTVLQGNYLQFRLLGRSRCGWGQRIRFRYG